MSDKTKQAKQAKQAPASWTAPTSVFYDRVLSPMYDEVARVLWPAWLHPNYITLLGGVFCTLSVLAMQRGASGRGMRTATLKGLPATEAPARVIAIVYGPDVDGT